MSKLFVGWAEESIVPNKKVSLDGQFFERISEYVESEISVTAMAVDSNNEQMILISADVAAIFEGVLELARDKFSKLTTEVDPKKIIVAATHTHTSLKMSNPNAKTSGGWDSLTILKEFLPEEKLYKEVASEDESIISPDESAEFVA